MSLIPKSVRLQSAADDANVIGDLVSDIGKLLDKFHAEHGEELYGQLEKAWPDAVNFGGSAPKPLFDLAKRWTPPED